VAIFIHERKWRMRRIFLLLKTIKLVSGKSNNLKKIERRIFNAEYSFSPINCAFDSIVYAKNILSFEINDTTVN